MGKPARGITGHMPRVSGARRMARAGVELWQIQLFARWESAVILRYVREAPLARSHLLAARMAASTDLAEMVDDAVSSTRLSAKEGDQWTAAVTGRVETAVGGAIPGVARLNAEMVKVAAKSILEEPKAADLPEFVLNGAHVQKSRHRIHRPRDAEFTFCTWAWADAIKAGVACTASAEVAQLYRFCDQCARKGQST